MSAAMSPNERLADHSTSSACTRARRPSSSRSRTSSGARSRSRRTARRSTARASWACSCWSRPRASTITMRVQGDDAEAAMDALAALVEDKFGEDERVATSARPTRAERRTAAAGSPTRDARASAARRGIAIGRASSSIGGRVKTPQAPHRGRRGRRRDRAPRRGARRDATSSSSASRRSSPSARARTTPHHRGAPADAARRAPGRCRRAAHPRGEDQRRVGAAPRRRRDPDACSTRSRTTTSASGAATSTSSATACCATCSASTSAPAMPPPGAIVVAHDLSPADTAHLHRAACGGLRHRRRRQDLAHRDHRARARDPAVVGLEDITELVGQRRPADRRRRRAAW